MNISITNCMTIQGTKPYIEDTCGYHNDTVWVFDGATSLSDTTYPDTLVHDFTRYLHDGMYHALSINNGSLNGILAQALFYCRSKLGTINFIHPYDVLSCAGVIARLSENEIEYVQFADVGCVIKSSSGIVHESIIESRFKDQQEIARNHISQLNKHDDQYDIKKREINRMIRSRMNREHGYPIISYDSQGIYHITPTKVQVDSPYEIELFSDGWEKLRDNFPSRLYNSNPDGFDDATYLSVTYN